MLTTPQLRAIEKSLCERSFYDFFKRAWHIVEPSEYIDNWHVEEICDRLQLETERIGRGEKRTKHLIITIPPRSSKSSVAAVMWNAWAWTRFPHMKFMSLSYSDRLASKHSMKTKKILKSDWYQSMWGDDFQHGVEIDTKTNYDTSKNGERNAIGVNGTITGEGADVIVIDDILSVKQSKSEKMRKNAQHVYTEGVGNRLNDPEIGIKVIIQQRTHADDLVGHELKENPDKYDLISIPAELIEKDGVSIQPVPETLAKHYKDGLFFPGRFNREVLTDFSDTMTDYPEQYLQLPKKPGGNILKKAWFPRFNLIELFKTARRNAEYEGEELLVWNFAIDGAFTEKTYNDPSVILAYTYYQNRWYVRARLRIRKAINDLVPIVAEFAMENGYSEDSMIFIEPKASGLDLIDLLVKQKGMNACEAVMPEGDKIAKAIHMSPTVKAKRVLINEEGDWKEYFDEIEGFPNVTHDDQVDTTGLMIENASSVSVWD